MDPLAMTLALFALIITTLTGLSWAQYSVGNVVLSQQRALVGDTLMASCDVKNEPRTRVLLYWVRVTPNDRPVEISVNRAVNNDFRNTGRYTVGIVKLSSDKRHMQVQLNITDLRTEDSGKLGLRLICPEGERFESWKDFAVTVPVQKVEWVLSEPNSTNRAQKYEGVSSIDLHEGQVRRFVCRVNGSFPQPQVKVFLGDQDVTSEFRDKSQLISSGGVLGLQPVYYEVELSQDALVVDYSYHEKTLSCRASLRADDVPPTLNSSLVDKNADLNITLLYKPKFLCNRVVYVKINEPNYNLVCKVHANPDVRDASVTFTDPNDANNTVDTLLGGAESGDYKANVTVGETEQETIIVLTINRVYKQHFRKYTFIAKSDLGTVSHEVMLKESFGNISTGATSLSTVALAVIAIVSLLHFCVYVQRC